LHFFILVLVRLRDFKIFETATANGLFQRSNWSHFGLRREAKRHAAFRPANQNALSKKIGIPNSQFPYRFKPL